MNEKPKLTEEYIIENVQKIKDIEQRKECLVNILLCSSCPLIASHADLIQKCGIKNNKMLSEILIRVLKEKKVRWKRSKLKSIQSNLIQAKRTT